MGREGYVGDGEGFWPEEDPLWTGYESFLEDLVAGSDCGGALLFVASPVTGGYLAVVLRSANGVRKKRVCLSPEALPLLAVAAGDREYRLTNEAIGSLLAVAGEDPALPAEGACFCLAEQRLVGFAVLGRPDWPVAVPPGLLQLLTRVSRQFARLLTTVETLKKERKLLNDTLSCLREANERLLEGGGFEAALERVLEAARSMVGAEGAGLLLYEEETGYLTLQKPAFGSYDEYRIGRYKVTTEEPSNAVRVFKTREPYVSNNAPQDPRFVKDLLDLFPARSVVSLPVVAGDRCIGVMHVTNKPGGFSEEDVFVLKSVVSQLAIAIANARLVSRIKMEETQSRVLYELSRDFNLLDADGLVRRAAEAASQVLPVLGVAIALRPEASDQPKIVAGGGCATGWVGRNLPAELLADELEVKDLRAPQTPVNWMEEEAAALGATSQVRVAVGTGGEVLGVLLAWTGGNAQLAPSQLRFLSLLGSQMAMAVRNARLFASEKRVTRRLERITSINEQIARLILEGAGIQAITEALAENLHRQVAFYDCRLVRRAWAGLEGEELAAAEQALKQVATEHLRDAPPDDTTPISVPGPQGRELVLVPIELGADVGGYLVLLVERKEEYEELKEIVLRVLPVYALELLKEQSRVAQGVIQYAEQELVSKLIGGSGLAGGEVLARAAGLGYDVGRPHLVAVCAPAEGGATGESGSGRAARRLSRTEVTEIRSFIRQSFPDSLRALVDGRIVVLIPDRPERTRRQLEVLARKYHLWIGVGGYVENLKDFPVAFSHACFSLGYARRFGLGPGVTCFQELGLYQALASEDTARCLYHTAVATLGPLLERDLERGTGYLKTLATFYAQGGSVKAAAEAMFCHPNTIRYRLERIRELLGIGIAEPDRRLNLEVALRVIRYYHPQLF
jgi:GAF domain-containing protein/sugar diacid utilization regulator